MELKIYLRLLIKKWWIVIPTFLVTLALTVVFTSTQAPVYQAGATFIVGPNASLQDVRSFVSGLEVLSRRTEIAGTYAEVADSRLIKRLAAETLGLSSGQRQSLSVESRVVAATNVLEITVLGNDPVLVRDFANAVAEETVSYVNQLYETYELTPLDPAMLPTSPVRPNKGLNFALGTVLGLALGAGLAFLSEYLQAPQEPATRSAILDTALAKDRKERDQSTQELAKALGEAIAEKMKVAMAEGGKERAPIDEVTAPAGEEEVPAWLREPRAEAAVEAEQESALLEEVEAPVEEVTAPAEEEEVPAWLREPRAEAGEEEEKEAAPLEEVEAPVEEVTAPTGEEEVPVWMRELGVVPVEEEEEERASLEEAEAPAEEVTAPAGEEEAPAWLRAPTAEAVEEEEEEEAPLEEVEAPVEEVTAPSGEEEVPAWLRELGVEAMEEKVEALVSIAELGLPTRIAGILRGAGIESVEGLLKKDDKELLSIRGFGAKALEQVNASLGAKGFIKG